jgi:hypothetical protein
VKEKKRIDTTKTLFFYFYGFSPHLHPIDSSFHTTPSFASITFTKKPTPTYLVFLFHFHCLQQPQKHFLPLPTSSLYFFSLLLSFTFTRFNRTKKKAPKNSKKKKEKVTFPHWKKKQEKFANTRTSSLSHPLHFFSF